MSLSLPFNAIIQAINIELYKIFIFHEEQKKIQSIFLFAHVTSPRPINFSFFSPIFLLSPPSFVREATAAVAAT